MAVSPQLVIAVFGAFFLWPSIPAGQQSVIPIVSIKH